MDDAIELPVFRAQNDAGTDRQPRAVRRHGKAVHQNLALPAAIGTIDQTGHFAAARADEAKEAENLAGADGKADRLGQVGAGNAFDRKPRGSERPGAPTPDIRNFAPDHFSDNLFAADFRDVRMMGCKPAVSQHSQAVAQTEDLVQPMRDIEDDRTIRPQSVDQGEEDFAFSR